jgi:hypothetical protein
MKTPGEQSSQHGRDTAVTPFALGTGRERQLLLANALRKKTPPRGSLKTQEKSSASVPTEFAVENDETSNSAWSSFRRFCELAQRNHLYGVALTDDERQVWDAARSGDEDHVTAALPIMAKIFAAAPKESQP